MHKIQKKENNEMITRDSLEKEISFYKEMYEKQSRFLRTMPDNNIFFKYQHKKWRPYTREAGVEQYLNKNNDHEKIALLMEKRLMESSVKRIKHNIKHMERLHDRFVDFDSLMPSSIGDELERKYGKGFCVKEYLPEFKFTKAKTAEARKWLSHHGQLNPYKQENRIHTTASGVKVRSKSELLIASFLEMKNIPYKSDELLDVGGNLWYPDFQIRRPRDGKIIIWEHFGMMDNIDYARKNQQRLIIYIEYGFRIMDNLIITYDENGTLDMTLLEKIYEMILK